MENEVYFRNALPHFIKILKHVLQGKHDPTFVKFSASYRLICVFSGSLELKSESNHYLLKAGDICFMPPKTKYTTAIQDNVELYNIFFGYGIRLDAISFNFETTLQHDCDICEKMTFLDLPKFNSCQHIVDFNEFHLIERLYDETSVDDVTTGLRLNRLFYALLYKMVKSFQPHLSSENKIISEIGEYIQKNIFRALSCQSIADHFNYHANYLNSLFKKNLNTSFHEYIVRHKIDKATKLLLETDLSITEIAMRLSFHDSSHFSKCFAKYVGHSPSSCRTRTV